MSKFTFQFGISDMANIHGVSQFAAKKDVRFYIKSVLFDLQGGVLRVVATDGNICGVAIAGRCDDHSASFKMILEDVHVAALLKNQMCEAIFDTDDKSISVKVGKQSQTFSAMDAVYPDWRRVLASSNEPEAIATFDPTLLARVGKAAKLVGTKSGYFGLIQRGDGAAHFTIGDDDDAIVGVIMSLRKSGSPAFDAALYSEIAGV